MRFRERLAATMILVVGVAGVAALARAQDEPTPNQESAPTEKAAPKQGGGLPNLLKGLKETPGCLGVETARTSSGKNVIFAWFKDKKSVLAWYKSDMHVGLMKSMGGGEGRGLVNVPDDAGPIMVVASITPSLTNKIDAAPLPISQISIEIYQPLPGGASIGGTFAPKEMDIPKMKRYDAEEVNEPKEKSDPK